MADPNALGLSDEEIMNMAPPEDGVVEQENTLEQDPAPAGDVVNEQDDQDNDTDVDDTDVADIDQDPDSELNSEDNVADDQTANEQDDAESATMEEDTPLTGDGEDTTVSTSEEDTSTDPADTSIDYEAEYKKILAPFKANGRDIKVNSIDDAIDLMRMGANYNKKMQGLKPSLKFLKMLENNKLLDESKLNFLIDLSKKDKNAISKLIKDSGIEPLDIDGEAAADYKPKSYTVSDGEVELDTVLSEIKDSKSYATTIEVITNKWDEASKRILIENPSIIKVINDHVSSGIYEQINQVVEQERMLGRLAGLSDIQAYKQVGDALQAQGAFNAPGQEQAPAANVAPKAAVKSKDPKIAQRRKAASATKSVSKTKTQSNYDPLGMSDEEIMKLSESNFT